MTRLLPWILAPLGALVLLALLRKSGRRLPRPLNRLAVAGMTLLVALGVSPLSLVACRSQAASPNDKEEPVKKDEETTKPDAWKRIERTLQDVDELSQRGPYPFDRKGKQQILDQIDARRSDVDALVASGALDAAEGGLLQKELDRAHAAMVKLRPTELMQATCYKPMMRNPRGDALTRLQAQVPLLEKIAEQKTVHAEVLRQALENVERDLATLEGTDGMALPPEKQAEAKALGERVRKALAAIEKKAGASAPNGK